MRRGDVWWINFDPSDGGEIRKKQPAVIISNDSSNRFLNRVQVVPMTSRIDRLYPSEAPVRFRGKESKVMADQLTTVSKRRLVNQEGRISGQDMLKVVHAVNIQLGLIDID